ncbi:hypothetical protein [Listeria marthii]|uniref:hypothetical protein n=1 Tax=Listeria marthii TaxID=529731 RepID=UPI00188871B5|nr:hypothetical protein [Listeria marthii]MBF2627652.1 hypothetical protein [Listeria marthii]
MNKIKRNWYYFVIILALIIGFSIPQQVTKAETIDEQFEQFIEEHLEDENITLDSMGIENDGINIEVSTTTTNNEEVSSEIHIIPGSQSIKINSIEINNEGKEEVKNYEINIDTINQDGDFEGTYKDLDSNKVEEIDSEDAMASFAFAIPVGINLGVWALNALYHAGAMIIVSGTAFVVASKATKKEKKYNHFEAVVKNGTVYIGNGLSSSKATSRLCKGKDTWSVSKNQANIIVKTVKAGKPVGPEVDKSNGKPKRGYYYHYHPANRSPKCHAFYGVAVK